MPNRKDNINDRDTRDEKTNEIRNQILDSAPEPVNEKNYMPTEDKNENEAGAAGTQTHENRENPLADHVPGHLGYNKHDNLINANVTSSQEEL